MPWTGFGYDAAKDFQPIYLEARRRWTRDGARRPGGRPVGGGAGWPGFMTMAKSEARARFIAPDREGIQRILAKHGFLRK